MDTGMVVVLLLFLGLLGTAVCLMYRIARSIAKAVTGEGQAKEVPAGDASEQEHLDSVAVPRPVEASTVWQRLPAETWSIPVAIVVVGFGLTTMWKTDHSKNDSERKERDNKSYAHIQCRAFVEDRLKAPGTADFPLYPEFVYPVGNGRYIVRSHVDAQNAFGAKLRSNFVCEVEFSGGEHADARNWTLHRLIFDER